MNAKEHRESVTVVLTDRALSDIRDIERFSVGRWGRKTADKYLDDIESALDRLSNDPALLRLEAEISRHVRFYHVRRHILVCDVRTDSIVVLTVIHCEMDIPSRLAELLPTLASEVGFLHQRLHGRSKDK